MSLLWRILPIGSRCCHRLGRKAVQSGESHRNYWKPEMARSVALHLGKRDGVDVYCEARLR